MNAVLSIARRELGAYFNTTIGYVFIVFFLVYSCYLYVQFHMFVEGVAEMRNYFNQLPMLYLFFIPAISMRLWAEERKAGTLELLLTFPVRTWHAVLGKFLAGVAFLVVTLALTLHIPAVLWALSTSGAGPDTGPLIGGYLGALFLGMVYLAVGSFASSLTSDQIVAFVIGASLNGLLFLISFPLIVNWVRDIHPDLAATISSFGVGHHFESIARGVVDTRDIVYALTVCGFFLFLNVLVIERRR